MPLSQTQKQLLEESGIPEEFQQFLGKELGEGGGPKPGGPDFLIILCNLLKISETRLEYLRTQLKNSMNIGEIQPIFAEPPPNISVLEDQIKDTWLRAAALWKATDKLVNSPELYAVVLRPQHVAYALFKNNLPVVEMIRYSRPEFFAIPSNALGRGFSAFLGAILGTLLGIVGGFVGAAAQVDRVPQPWLRLFAVPVYALIGMISGGAMGSLKASSFGYETGSLFSACEFGLLASYLNPFHDSLNSKYAQAVALKKEEILFELTHGFAAEKALSTSL